MSESFYPRAMLVSLLWPKMPRNHTREDYMAVFQHSLLEIGNDKLSIVSKSTLTLSEPDN